LDVPESPNKTGLEKLEATKELNKIEARETRKKLQKIEYPNI